jgi:predicted transcriptional regulator of viral defense system
MNAEALNGKNKNNPCKLHGGGVMKVDEVNRVLKEKKYMTRQELLDLGVSDSLMSRWVQTGKLNRVSRGIYSCEEDLMDIMYLLQQKYKRAIFSHESALYLHDLSDRIPETHVMTVYRNYNVKKNEITPVVFRYVDEKVHGLAVIEMNTIFGNRVKVYDVERTICDVIRSETKMEKYTVNVAIRQYAKTAKFSKLMIYAKQMGIEKIVMKKIDVLL